MMHEVLFQRSTCSCSPIGSCSKQSIRALLDPAVPRLFIIDGSKALSKAIRGAFGRDAVNQRCQIHKARNILNRLPKSMHAQTRRALRQACEMDDAG